MKRKPRRQFDRLTLVQELATEPITTPTNNNQGTFNSGTGSFMLGGSTTAAPNIPGVGAASDPTVMAGTGVIWVMKFNRDGRYLAAGGQDGVLRVWTLTSEPDEPKDPKDTLNVSSNPTDRVSEPPSNTASFSVHRKLPAIFKSKPFREYRGHKTDILDLSWSKVFAVY